MPSGQILTIHSEKVKYHLNNSCSISIYIFLKLSLRTVDLQVFRKYLKIVMKQIVILRVKKVY